MPVMELPIWCSHCGRENMIDLERLDSRPLSKIFSQEGFICEHCGQWKSVFYNTQSLKDAMRKLDEMSLVHKDYRFHFAKTVRKAMDVQKRATIQKVAGS